MEEIHVWRSTRDAEAWVFYFEKCKLFRMKHESNLPNNYIALRCHRHPASKSLRSANKESFTCPFKIIVQGKLTSVSVPLNVGEFQSSVLILDIYRSPSTFSQDSMTTMSLRRFFTRSASRTPSWLLLLATRQPASRHCTKWSRWRLGKCLHNFFTLPVCTDIWTQFAFYL